MRNNLLSFSGTELMGVGAVYGPGLYFSDATGTANSYAHPSGQCVGAQRTGNCYCNMLCRYDSAPMFVLEAAGGERTWEKSSSICTSLFPSCYHAAIAKMGGHRSPHANVVVRGIFMDSSRSGAPSTTYGSRAYFERARAAYAEIVGSSTWGRVDDGALASVAPGQGFKASAFCQ